MALDSWQKWFFYHGSSGDDDDDKDYIQQQKYDQDDEKIFLKMKDNHLPSSAILSPFVNVLPTATIPLHLHVQPCDRIDDIEL